MINSFQYCRIYEMVIRLSGKKRIDASYQGFEIKTDQSPKNGGDASAPEPFDLFLASVGTCAGYYALSFCETRKIPTDGIRLVQTWERDPKSRRLTKIRIDIIVPPTFPEKYHKALVKAASYCSVKRVLDDPPVLETQTVVGSG